MTVYTIYSDAEDGFVLSTGSGTYAAAAAMTSNPSVVGNSLQIGQQVSDSLYEIDESFLSFITSVVSGTITTAVLSIFVPTGGNATDQDFTIEARIHDWGATLTTADVVAPGSLGGKTLVASKATSGVTENAYNDFADVALPANVNQSGTTYLILNSDRHRLATGPTPDVPEYVQGFASEQAGTTQDPKLVVTTDAEAGPVDTRNGRASAINFGLPWH